MTTIFTDIGRLLTLDGAAAKKGRRVGDEDLSPIEDATLVAQDGKIVWLGPKKSLKSATMKALGKDAKTVSLEGRTVIPGFVEPHTHLIFAGNRAHEFEWRMRGETYQEIAAKGGGIRYTVGKTREASEKDLQQLAQTRADRFVAQGVTTLEVKSGYGLDLETEMRSLKVARAVKGPKIVTTYLGPHAASPDFDELDVYLDHICEKVLPEVAKKKLADRVDIYVEEGFFNLEQERRYFERARELGFAITAHVEQFTDRGGADQALEFKPQSVDHLVFANDFTIQKLAHAETTAVLLPASDFYLKMQYPRARAMLENGVRVALSTDFNPGTSPTQDLSLVGVLARVEMKMSLAETIVAFTLGGAYALGLEKQIGSLVVGKDCDFNVLNGDWNELFYSVGHHPIAAVYRSAKKLNPSQK